MAADFEATYCPMENIPDWLGLGLLDRKNVPIVSVGYGEEATNTKATSINPRPAGAPGFPRPAGGGGV